MQLAQNPTSISSEPCTPDERWSVDDYDWLIHDGQKVLWLPPDFRPTCKAVHKDLFALGHESGDVTFFKGSSDYSMPEGAYEFNASDNSSKGRRRVWDEFFHLGKGLRKSRA